MQSDQLVVQTEHLSKEAAAWLGQRCRLVACPHDSSDFHKVIADAAGLVVRTYTIVNEDLLIRAPKLRVVGRAGVGLDNIDLPACRRRGIEVVYTPDANTQAVVEYVVTFLGDALRPRVRLTKSIDTKEWNHLRDITFAKRQMNQLTLGILGLGRVGKRLAKVAGAIGFRVLYNDLLEIAQSNRFGAEPVDAHALFEQSDIVSVHIDGRPSNARFIHADLICAMKSDVVFINTSRGFVVDNSALADWLTRRPDARALLDVHDPEPFGPDYPLLKCPNAWLYPHLASRTETAMLNMSWVVRDVAAVLEGRTPEFPAPAR